jgi:hypothetical protein
VDIDLTRISFPQMMFNGNIFYILHDANGITVRYKCSEEQRAEQQEQERDEAFYVEVDKEEVARPIAVERPTTDTVVVCAIEQDEEALEEEPAVDEDDIIATEEMHAAREKGIQRTLWDS